MRVYLRLLVASLAVLASAQGGAAITLGQLDDFEDGTTQGWVINLLGMGSPPAQVLPANVATGGPQGADDNYLRLASLGGAGAGSRLGVIHVAGEWAGDYTAAGVTRIAMQVNNLGATDLALRLLFADPTVGPPSNQAITSDPILVPAGAGWTQIAFDVAPGDLTALLGTVGLALSGATELRLIHAPNAVFPGPEVVAQLGVDDIHAVPEPSVAMLVAASLGALAAKRRGARCTRHRA